MRKGPFWVGTEQNSSIKPFKACINKPSSSSSRTFFLSPFFFQGWIGGRQRAPVPAERRVHALHSRTHGRQGNQDQDSSLPETQQQPLVQVSVRDGCRLYVRQAAVTVTDWVFVLHVGAGLVAKMGKKIFVIWFRLVRPLDNFYNKLFCSRFWKYLLYLFMSTRHVCDFVFGLNIPNLYIIYMINPCFMTKYALVYVWAPAPRDPA